MVVGWLPGVLPLFPCYISSGLLRELVKLLLAVYLAVHKDYLCSCDKVTTRNWFKILDDNTAVIKYLQDFNCLIMSVFNNSYGTI